ncbi:SDR family oxidoreductase [Amycolatopsis thailandensis]|uniref:SDR family oxidoreductase n=1 Tax=Amycolatopsis thailandensis TaxID=589330 RepID=UPI00378E1506
MGTTGPAFLVTGATGPVAEATIRLMAKRGDRLLLTGRDRARLAELDRAYGAEGQVETYAVDVTAPGGADEAAARAAERFGGLGGLVHLVGSFHAGPVVFTGAEHYERLLRVNFLSAVTVTQAVLPRLSDGGRLVYFGTPLAQEPLAALSAYAASKAALLAWVRSLAHEVKHRGVHANAVVMTMADTPQARADRPQADFSEAVTPELVAGAVGFLTSDAADGLYGSLVPVLGRFGFSTALAAGPPRGGGNG